MLKDFISDLPNPLAEELAFYFLEILDIVHMLQVSKHFNALLSKNLRVNVNGKMENKTLIETKLESDIKKRLFKFYKYTYTDSALIFNGFNDLQGKKTLFQLLQTLEKLITVANGKVNKLEQDKEFLNSSVIKPISEIQTEINKIENSKKELFENLKKDGLKLIKEQLNFNFDLDNTGISENIRNEFKTRNPILLMVAYQYSNNPFYLFAAFYASEGKDITILIKMLQLWNKLNTLNETQIHCLGVMGRDVKVAIKNFWKNNFEIDLKSHVNPSLSELKQIGISLLKIKTSNDLREFCNVFRILCQKTDNDLTKILALGNLHLLLQSGEKLSLGLNFYSYQQLKQMQGYIIFALNIFDVPTHQKLANNSELMDKFQIVAGLVIQQFSPKHTNKLRELNFLFNHFGAEKTLELKNLMSFLESKLADNVNNFKSILSCYSYEQLNIMPKEVIEYLFSYELTGLNFHQQLAHNKNFRSEIYCYIWPRSVKKYDKKITDKMNYYIVHNEHINLNEWTFKQLEGLQITFLQTFPKVLKFSPNTVLDIQNVIRILLATNQNKLAQCEFYDVFFQYIFNNKRTLGNAPGIDNQQCLIRLTSNEEFWSILSVNRSLTEELLSRKLIKFTGFMIEKDAQFEQIVSSGIFSFLKDNPKTLSWISFIFYNNDKQFQEAIEIFKKIKGKISQSPSKIIQEYLIKNFEPQDLIKLDSIETNKSLTTFKKITGLELISQSADMTQFLGTLASLDVQLYLRSKEQVEAAENNKVQLARLVIDNSAILNTGNKRKDRDDKDRPEDCKKSYSNDRIR